MLARQRFRPLQHLINPAARLDTAGNGQFAIRLQPQIALPAQCLLHCRQSIQRAFNPAAGRGRFGKRRRQIGGKTLPTLLRRLHIGKRKTDIGRSLRKRSPVRITP